MAAARKCAGRPAHCPHTHSWPVALADASIGVGGGSVHAQHLDVKPRSVLNVTLLEDEVHLLGDLVSVSVVARELVYEECAQLVLGARSVYAGKAAVLSNFGGILEVLIG